MKSEEWTATIVADIETLTRVRRGWTAPKDVKNGGRSGNVYENKGSTDTMTEIYSGFCAWSAPFLQKWRKIQRAFRLNAHKSEDNCGESRTRIGSSVNRPSDPLAEPGVVLQWRDDPIIRWPDHLAFPLCTSKQKRLTTNGQNLVAIDLVETKPVSLYLVAGQGKNAGGKYEGIFHYVIENKWWKIVRNVPFHYVDENKDSYSRSFIMFMKIQVVIQKAVTSDE